MDQAPQPDSLQGRSAVCQPSPARRGPSRRCLTIALRVGVALGVMAFIFYSQDIGALRSVLGQVDGLYLGASTLAFFLGQVLLAIRWWVLLGGLGLDVKVSVAIKLHLLGLFYNNIMPTSVGGDVIRAYYITKHTDNVIAAAASVFIDRLVAVISMLVMLIFIAVLWPWHSDLHLVRFSNTRSFWTAASWACVVIVCLLAGGALMFVFRPGLGRAIVRTVRPVAKTLAACVRMYGSRPYIPLAAVGLTILLQTIIILAFWVLGRGMGIEAGLRYYLIIFPLTWLLSAIPISVAGVGLLEGGMVGLYVHLAAVPQEKALALALCQRFAWIMAALPGGIIHMLGKHQPDSISVDGRANAG